MRNLSGRQFHGTNAVLPEGAVLEPGRSLGKKNFDYSPTSDHPGSNVVWGSDWEETAWGYAQHAVEKQGGGQQMVYEVEMDNPRTDPDFPFVKQSERATVKRALQGPAGSQFTAFPDEQGRAYRPQHEMPQDFSDLASVTDIGHARQRRQTTPHIEGQLDFFQDDPAQSLQSRANALLGIFG